MIAKRILNYGRPVNWQSPLNRGLVAWWLKLPLRGGGNRLIDLCNRYHGTLQGATWAARPNGWGSMKCVRASSQYASIGSALITAAPLTITGWFNSNDSVNSQEVVSIGNTGASGEAFRLNIVGGSMTVRAITSASGANRLSASTKQWVGNDWYFGSAVFASVSSRIGYVNGNPGIEDTNSATPSGLNATSIGRLEFGSPTNYFSGMIDDVRIYNRALSASEIKQLYNAGRARYPRELNWVQRLWINSQAAAAAGKIPWHLFTTSL